MKSAVRRVDGSGDEQTEARGEWTKKATTKTTGKAPAVMKL